MHFYFSARGPFPSYFFASMLANCKLELMINARANCMQLQALTTSRAGHGPADDAGEARGQSGARARAARCLQLSGAAPGASRVGTERLNGSPSNSVEARMDVQPQLQAQV